MTDRHKKRGGIRRWFAKLVKTKPKNAPAGQPDPKTEVLEDDPDLSWEAPVSRRTSLHQSSNFDKTSPKSSTSAAWSSTPTSQCDTTCAKQPISTPRESTSSLRHDDGGRDAKRSGGIDVKEGQLPHYLHTTVTASATSVPTSQYQSTLTSQTKTHTRQPARISYNKEEEEEGQELRIRPVAPPFECTTDATEQCCQPNSSFVRSHRKSRSLPSVDQLIDGNVEGEPSSHRRSNSNSGRSRSKRPSSARRRGRKDANPPPSVVHYHLNIQNCGDVNIRVTGDAEDDVITQTRPETEEELSRFSWVQEHGGEFSSPRVEIMPYLDDRSEVCSSHRGHRGGMNSINTDPSDMFSSCVGRPLTDNCNNRRMRDEELDLGLTEHLRNQTARLPQAAAPNPSLGQSAYSGDFTGTIGLTPSEKTALLESVSPQTKDKSPCRHRPRTPPIHGYVGTGLPSPSGSTPRSLRQEHTDSYVSGHIPRAHEPQSDSESLTTPVAASVQSGTHTPKHHLAEDTEKAVNRPVAVVQPLSRSASTGPHSRSRRRVCRAPSVDSVADYNATASSIAASITADLDLQMAMHNLNSEVARQTVTPVAGRSRRNRERHVGRHVQRDQLQYVESHDPYRGEDYDTLELFREVDRQFRGDNGHTLRLRERLALARRDLVRLPGVLIVDTLPEGVVIYLSRQRPNVEGVVEYMTRAGVGRQFYHCEILPWRYRAQQSQGLSVRT